MILRIKERNNKMLKKIILIILLGLSSLYAQEVVDIAFPINGTTLATDSVRVPEGMIPSAIWSSTLIAGTTVGFNMSVDGGTTFLGVAEMGEDTTAWAVPLDKDAGLIVPLQPTKAYIMKGAWDYESDQTWLQLTSSVAQTTTTSIINVRFIPYTGKDR